MISLLFGVTGYLGPGYHLAVMVMGGLQCTCSMGRLVHTFVQTVAGRFVTVISSRSFRHNLRSFRHSQFVTPELPNQRRFGCPALYYNHDYTMGQSSKQLQRLLARLNHYCLP